MRTVFCLFMIVASLSFIGCEEENVANRDKSGAGQSQPAPNPRQPSVINPGNSILRISQADITPIQNSSPRLLADLTIAPNINRPITSLTIHGYLRTNDKTATGRLVISVDGTRLGSLSLDQIPVNADPDSFSLEVDNFGGIDSNGARVTVTLESDHGTGDTVQLEVLYIESNLGADAKPRLMDSVLCG